MKLLKLLFLLNFNKTVKVYNLTDANITRMNKVNYKTYKVRKGLTYLNKTPESKFIKKISR